MKIPPAKLLPDYINQSRRWHNIRAPWLSILHSHTHTIRQAKHNHRRVVKMQVAALALDNWFHIIPLKGPSDRLLVFFFNNKKNPMAK